MRLSSFLTASASIGAAIAAELPVKGPFEIRVVDISNTSAPWASNIATVSHGAVILSLATGQPAQFTWSDDNRLVPVGHEGIHSSVGDYGSILTFVGPDGPNDPGAPDKPLAQFQTDVGGDAFLIVEGEQGSLFQWNTIFTAENLPRGFAYADPTGTEANAGLVIKEL